MTSILKIGSPPLLIGVSKALQAMATPLIAFLVLNADEMSGGTKNPISFCNVLFVGNTCAALVVLAMFGPARVMGDLKKLTPWGRGELLIFGALSALLSALIYTALEEVSVTNAILLARLGPVLYAIATAVLLGQVLEGAQWAGFSVIVLGIVATVLGTNGLSLGRGDILILSSSFVYAAVTLLSRRLLTTCQLSTVVLARNGISAVVFFTIANIVYGPHHFADAFSGQLWMIMAVYSAIVIVAAQLLWYAAVGSVSPATVAQWTVITPIITITYAFFLNGERPSGAQLTALGLVTIGVVISQVGRLVPKTMSDAPESSVAAS